MIDITVMHVFGVCHVDDFDLGSDAGVLGASLGVLVIATIGIVLISGMRCQWPLAALCVFGPG